MSKSKIFNDPVYGFVNVPYGIIFDIVEHPFFQRLRRIKQVSLTHYVYPGALHTRFHHALGAMHLMHEAIKVLREKGVDITDEEAEATLIAILLHDIGHGPFSHTLEHALINVHHEELSALFMESLNKEFDGQLGLAIEIFENRYHKPYLYQLISGQLDMDRMDYLNRDSYFTGVYEGVIGYDRIIKMLAVKDGDLVVEEKGIYSIEKFLMSRRLMYWQVYLHKTVLVAEQMLIRVMLRAKELARAGSPLNTTESLQIFLENDFSIEDFKKGDVDLLAHFARLDDIDIVAALKSFMANEDKLLSFLATSLINRNLFKINLKNEAADRDFVKKLRQKVRNHETYKGMQIEHLVFEGTETNNSYSTAKDEIKILYKDGSVKPMSTATDIKLESTIITKYFLCYPKNLL